MRAVRRIWRRLELGWRASLRRLPFFTQRTAVLLAGVLVASLAMLGGVVALVGWPGANGPTHLVPGERFGQRPESRPGPGTAAPGGPRDAGSRRLGRRGTRVRRCGRRGRRGPAGRTADHLAVGDDHDHRPPGPPRPGRRPPRPGRLHPAALIHPLGC